MLAARVSGEVRMMGRERTESGEGCNREGRLNGFVLCLRNDDVKGEVRLLSKEEDF